MFSLLENISEQRLSNIQAAAYEIQVRLRDALRSGLFRMASDVLGNTELLRRRLIDNQAPGLASMLARLSELNTDSIYWKREFVGAVSRIYMLSTAIGNIKNLDTVWQNEVLMLAGVSFPQAEVSQSDAVNDVWLCLAATRSSFNSMTMIRTWFVGRASRRIACNIEYVAGTHHIASMLSPGTCYNSAFHFFPGIHSMRIIHDGIGKSWQVFAPQAYQGLDVALRICRRAFSDNPFMLDIPLIMSGLRIARTDSGLSIVDSALRSFPLEVSADGGQLLLSCTGGQEFSAFVFFHQNYCELASVWANGKYFVIYNESDR